MRALGRKVVRLRLAVNTGPPRHTRGAPRRCRPRDAEPGRGGGRKPWLVKRSTPSSSAPARPARRWPRAAAKRRPAHGAHRARALRRHLRQHRLHSDQDADCQRARCARRAARRRIRLRRSTAMRVDMTARQGAQGRGRAPTRATVSRNGCAALANFDVDRRRGPLRRAARGAVGDARARRPSASSSTSAAARWCPSCPACDDVPLPRPAARSWSSTSVPEHLVIVGGSYVGLEFAQMYAPLRRRA